MMIDTDRGRGDRGCNVDRRISVFLDIKEGGVAQDERAIARYPLGADLSFSGHTNRK